jgi:hypothetical protein
MRKLHTLGHTEMGHRLRGSGWRRTQADSESEENPPSEPSWTQSGRKSKQQIRQFYLRRKESRFKTNGVLIEK